MTLLAQLLPLSRQSSPLFLFGRGHVNRTEGLVIAMEVTVQIHRQVTAVGLIGGHAGVPLVQAHRMHDQILDSQGDQLAMKHKPTRPRFIATMHLAGEGQLLPGELQERLRTKTLGWLWRGAIDHPTDSIVVGVPVDTEFDLVVTRPLRLSLGCGVFAFGMSVGFYDVFHHVNLGGFSALFNTHAILVHHFGPNSALFEKWGTKCGTTWRNSTFWNQVS